MLRLAFDLIIAWREIRARPNAYVPSHNYTGILTELYRCPGITLPTVSYWFAYI